MPGLLVDSDIQDWWADTHAELGMQMNEMLSDTDISLLRLARSNDSLRPSACLAMSRLTHDEVAAALAAARTPPRAEVGGLWLTIVLGLMGGEEPTELTAAMESVDRGLRWLYETQRECPPPDR